MKKFGVFDIVGPIMIGPSSSHTAGAVRLAKIARIIAGKDIKSVEFYLHGSFAKTYKGHGTDRALVAGILGMEPWDERLRDSIKIAKDENIDITFHEADLGDVHPNTVKFIIHKYDGIIIDIMGSSVGGGNIKITRVNGEEIEFTGAYPTLIINHIDIPGMISKVTALLYEGNINIAFMKVYRNKRGANATMVFETDSVVEENIVQNIKSIPYIGSVKVISPTEE